MSQLNESILNGVFFFSILQALLFALLSLTKKKRSLPDYIIGVWLLLLAIQTILIFSTHNRLINSDISHLPIIVTLLYGPMQYLYVYKICSGDKKMRINELFHFIPFLFFLIITITCQDTRAYIKVLAGTSAILGLVYCIFTLYILKKHLSNIKNQFSFTEKINLSWLNKLVFGLIIIWFGVVILVFLRRIYNFDLPLGWFYITIPVFIFYIGYNGIKQQVIYSFYIDILDRNNPLENPSKQISNRESYQNSGLRQAQKEAIYQSMLNLMQSEKLYLNPTLSMQELSGRLNIPPHHITQTLNEYVNTNFYDFVNTYRINEFKKRVEEGSADTFSLLGIALDCGFNSKSSFNRIFKNTTGQTPSEYKRVLST